MACAELHAPAALPARTARPALVAAPALLVVPLHGMLAPPCGISAKLHCRWRMASLPNSHGSGAACTRAAGRGVLAPGGTSSSLTPASACAEIAAAAAGCGAAEWQPCCVAASDGQAPCWQARAAVLPACSASSASAASTFCAALLPLLLPGLPTGLPVSTVSSSDASQKECSGGAGGVQSTRAPAALLPSHGSPTSCSTGVTDAAGCATPGSSLFTGGDASRCGTAGMRHGSQSSVRLGPSS